ncbi:MAG: ROK family protein, partial [Planctomycetota bacterium]
MSDSRTDIVVGVDLGGTKIFAAGFDAAGDVRTPSFREATEASRDASVTIANLDRCVESAVRSASGRIVGIGVGTTGPLNPWSGVLLEPETLPQLFGFPLAKHLSERFELPVAVSNDANCFALGEALFGAGRGASVVLGITLGTGCGVGIVIDGKIHEGASGNAGEVYRARLGEFSFDEILSGGGLEILASRAYGESVNGPELHRRASRADATAA